MTAFKFIVSIYLAGITLLLVDDYFPGTLDFLRIPKSITIIVLLFFFVTSGYFVKDTKDEKYALIWSITFMVYCVFLMILLKVLGGVSKTGISLDNPIIWLLIAISIFEIMRKKANKK